MFSNMMDVDNINEIIEEYQEVSQYEINEEHIMNGYSVVADDVEEETEAEIDEDDVFNFDDDSFYEITVESEIYEECMIGYMMDVDNDEEEEEQAAAVEVAEKESTVEVADAENDKCDYDDDDNEYNVCITENVKEYFDSEIIEYCNVNNLDVIYIYEHFDDIKNKYFNNNKSNINNEEE